MPRSPYKVFYLADVTAFEYMTVAIAAGQQDVIDAYKDGIHPIMVAASAILTNQRMKSQKKNMN